MLFSDFVTRPFYSFITLLTSFAISLKPYPPSLLISNGIYILVLVIYLTVLISKGSKQLFFFADLFTAQSFAMYLCRSRFYGGLPVF